MNKYDEVTHSAEQVTREEFELLSKVVGFLVTSPTVGLERDMYRMRLEAKDILNRWLESQEGKTNAASDNG